ncbi:smooth muscle caldesmon [Angomonas deanei]|uniref:Uncharacterized protein n=1 Tax=Angomonas deanei TaxID=59799 RepID=A0A7G2C3T7_9TRYP|nr:smooth muscle caldesmon [Angomonas deanei]CAD2214249.1 hypothetical protein, conserved [Angomonas deanei]|eukprot:EPY20001.1 smooth muscle caldesmon [Angomonas deanei]
MPAPQEEEQINLDISDSTSSIQFDTASPEKTETPMVEEKEEAPAVEEKPEKAEKTKKPTRGAKEKERKTERQKTAEKVTKEAEKPKERKKQKSREEKPKPAAKADSRKSTPQERPLSIASSRSGRQEKRSISPHSEKPVRYASSASEDSRASRHHSRTPSEVSIEPRKSAKKRHGQAIPGGEPSSFDLYSKRKTRRAKASPRRRRPSPREEDQLDYLELLQQCREDARYLYNRRSNQRSPSYGRSETKRYTANREASRHSTPRRSPRGFRERELVEEPVLRSPYTQGNYNWRERDVYDPIEGYEEEYVPSDREYYRPTRRSRSADRTGRVDELNDSYYQAQAQRLRSPRSERRLSNHSSRVASPNAQHRSLSVEQRFRSPQHSGRQTPSVASEVSETDLLDEVEWKLDALAQEIVVEDTILEERMRSSPFERLYHMNNRRDRDERRKKLVQYTSLEKIRQKLLDGSVEREIEEREHKKRQQEALLQDPSGVYLRLYNNSYAASRAANRSGDGHVSPLTSPRRPSRRNSALSNGSANRRPTPKRSSSYIKELSTRLYKGGAVLQNQQRERQEQTAAEREEQEIEDFLVARLMARSSGSGW